MFLSHAQIKPLNSRSGEFCQDARKPGERGAPREQPGGKGMQKQI